MEEIEMNKNKKVTLLELVATKVIYAVLIAVYYWMWARRDWHDYYEMYIPTAQNHLHGDSEPLYRLNRATFTEGEPFI